jgi:hypothetical protein
VHYDSGAWSAAFSIAKWENHEAIFFTDDTLIYDGVGAELCVDYAYSDRLHLYGGFNYTDPDIDDPRVDPDFGVEHLLLGASVFATDESFAYLEALLSSGKDVNGRHEDSVLSVGYRFDFWCWPYCVEGMPHWREYTTSRSARSDPITLT